MHRLPPSSLPNPTVARPIRSRAAASGRRARRETKRRGLYAREHRWARDGGILVKQ